MRSCTFAPPGLSPLGGRSSTSSLCRSVVVRWACPSTQLPAHQRFFPGGGAVPEHIRTTLCPPSPTSARQQTFSVRAPSAGTFPPCFALLIPAPHAVDRSSAPAARLPVTDLHDVHTRHPSVPRAPDSCSAAALSSPHPPTPPLTALPLASSRGVLYVNLSRHTGSRVGANVPREGLLAKPHSG